MVMPRAPKVSALEEMFTKYEFLVYQYAGRLFNYEQLGYDRDDVTQELRVKLYTSILTYVKKWKEYRDTGRRKPVPAFFYLRTCLISHVNDNIRKIKRSEELFAINSGNSSGSISAQFTDKGTHNPNVIEIDLGASQVASINGVNLFGGLRGLERVVWSLFLKGYSETEIARKLRTRLLAEGYRATWVKQVIDKQRSVLQGYRKQLILEDPVEYTVREILED